MYKSFLKVIFAAGMVYVSSLHAAIVASGDDCGEDCHWEFDEETKTLNISGSGVIKNYNRYCTGFCYTDAPWQAYKAQIIELNIGEGFTSVGDHAFEDMFYAKAHLPETMEKLLSESFRSLNLSEINLPHSLQSIGSWAFEGTALTEIEIPPQVTRLEAYVFGNTPLTKLVIPEGIEYIDGSAFGDASRRSNLTEIYCTQAQAEQCQAAVAYLNITPTLYYKTGDGKYVVGNKTYASLADLQKGIYIPRRIYTIEEAEAAVKAIGKDHVKFRIRYK